MGQGIGTLIDHNFFLTIYMVVVVIISLAIWNLYSRTIYNYQFDITLLSHSFLSQETFINTRKNF